MDAIQRLTDRLQGARQTSESRWIARCPAHTDKSPSLAIQTREDGRILLHCFAGCETAAVLQAAGLTFSDLFPAPLSHWLPPLKTTLSARELWELTAHEADVVYILLEQIPPGVFTEIGMDRLRLACERIGDARRYVGG
jgi:hypothetical protein